jgi:GT2 family glycosyltransferase
MLPKASSNPTLSIIIVSWNVAELLRECLRSVAENRGDLDLEVIVVDSASADNTVALISAEFPWVTLLAQSENVGFPRGNNIGLAAATGDTILLLNPDTEIMGDALTVMVDYLQQHPDIGLIGPQLLNPDGSHQSSRRRFPTVMTGLFESTWLQSLAPRATMSRFFATDLPDDATSDVDWVTGACMLTRRAVVAQVGVMDEAYFMYSEELDWCKRIKDAGWRVVYLPNASVVHHVGKSSEQAVTARHINFNRAKLRYFRKHHGYLAYLILRVVIWKQYVLQIILEGSKGLLGHKRALRKQRVRSYWQVVKSGLKAAGY